MKGKMPDSQPNINNGGNPAPTENGVNQQNGTDPNKTVTPEGKQSFDPSKLTDDQLKELSKDERFWGIAFTHERFKKLSDAAKKADEYQKSLADAEDKKLRDDKKFEELANKYKADFENLQKKLTDETLGGKIIAEASKLGARDPEVVLKLIDRSGISVLTDGTVSGISEAIKKLQQTSSYLFTTSNVSLGSGSNPSNANTGAKFKMSQLSDARFYREHEKEILEAMRNGQIENDTPGLR